MEVSSDIWRPETEQILRTPTKKRIVTNKCLHFYENIFKNLSFLMQNDDFLCFGHVTTERCVATPLWPIPDDFTLNNVFQVSQRKPTHKVGFRISLKLLHLPCILAQEKCSTRFDCFRKLSRVVPVSAAPYITICPRCIKFKYYEDREKHFTPILSSHQSFIYTNQYLPFR